MWRQDIKREMLSSEWGQSDESNRSARIWFAAALIVLMLIPAVGLYAWIFVYNPCEVDVVNSTALYAARGLQRYVGKDQRTCPALNSEYYETSQSTKFYKISQVMFFIPCKILKWIDLA